MAFPTSIHFAYLLLDVYVYLSVDYPRSREDSPLRPVASHVPRSIFSTFHI
jgi:hypothetical protein